MARYRATAVQMDHYQTLLDKNAADTLSAEEWAELAQLRTEFDRRMLQKAHAAALS